MCLCLLQGCYRFGARLANSGYTTVTKNAMIDCNQLCNNNIECYLFQWNKNNNKCKLFGKARLNENEIFTREVNAVIGVPDCIDEKVIWLKRSFEISTTTTKITTRTSTISPTTESINTSSAENGNLKYKFLIYLIHI
jgi:hypothetical protein